MKSPSFTFLKSTILADAGNVLELRNETFKIIFLIINI